MSPDTLSRTLHRRRVSDGFLLFSIIALMVGLLGLAIVQGVNTASDQGQGTAITEIKGEIKQLCTSGAIDCTGTSDLPPPVDGKAGTGIKSVSCTKGQFRFVFTTGRVSKVGRCVAVDGRQGPRGLIGVPGPKGEKGDPGRDGFVSAEQVRRVAASVLAGYCAAHNQCRGPRGPRGPKGDQGEPGDHHHGGPGPHRIRHLLCLVVPCRQ